MGIIADTFAAQLAELKRRDEESQRETQAMLARIDGLIKKLERLELNDDDRDQ